MIITTTQFQTFFCPDDSTSHSLQNCVFQSSICVCTHIDKVNLQREVETFESPLSVSHYRETEKITCA